MTKRGKTKQLIVEEALIAFNEARYGAVTTAALAERLGMAEGNLWYHYRTKRALLDAIQALFVDESRSKLAALQEISDPIDAYIGYLLVWRDLFVRYFFIFRDRGEYGTHSPDMAKALSALYASIEDTMSKIYTTLIDQKLLNIKKQDIEELVFNAILITRYFFEFLDERHRESQAIQNKSSRAILQHLTLLKDRLEPRALTRIRQALTPERP